MKGILMRWILTVAVLLSVQGAAVAQLPADGCLTLTPALYEVYSETVRAPVQIPGSTAIPVMALEQQQSVPGRRSALKAALFSLVLPGAGQWYAGSRIKAAGFFLADVAMWFGRRHYNNKGDEIDEEFRLYADQYWSRDEYIYWLDQQDDSVKEAFAHTLPDTKTQQYYEMIGKYEQFLAGWPDSDGPPQNSEMRLYYMARQDAGNDKYKTADTMAQLMILNRVISAAEAALSVHRKNSRVQPGLTFEHVPGTRRLMPAAHLTVIW